MLAPMYDRFRYTLKYYRGVDFIPTDTNKFPWAARLAKWAAAITTRDSFISTASTEENYLVSYESYAGVSFFIK